MAENMLRVTSSPARVNKTSLSPVDTGNLCRADANHHFDFISSVNVYLWGVMKDTLHVLRGLCAVAADIIKLT